MGPTASLTLYNSALYVNTVWELSSNNNDDQFGYIGPVPAVASASAVAANFLTYNVGPIWRACASSFKNTAAVYIAECGETIFYASGNFLGYETSGKALFLYTYTGAAQWTNPNSWNYAPGTSGVRSLAGRNETVMVRFCYHFRSTIKLIACRWLVLLPARWFLQPTSCCISSVSIRVLTAANNTGLNK